MLPNRPLPIQKLRNFWPDNCYLCIGILWFVCVRVCVLFCKSDNLWTLLNGLLWIRLCRFGSIGRNWSRSIPLWASFLFEPYRWFNLLFVYAFGCVSVCVCIHLARRLGAFFGLVSFWDQSIMLSHVEILESMEQQQPAAASNWTISISCMAYLHTAKWLLQLFRKDCIIFSHLPAPDFIKLQSVHSSK